MDITELRYKELLPEEISVKHKISEKTEKKNFHLHKQIEVLFTLSDNICIKFETGNQFVKIPQNSIVLIDSMQLHFMFTEPGSGMCDRYVLYFSPNFISYLSTPEVNLLECFIIRNDENCVILHVPEDQQKGFLDILSQMENAYQQFISNDQIQDERSDKPELSPINVQWKLYLKLLLGQFLILTNQLYYLQCNGTHTWQHHQHVLIANQISNYIKEHFNEKLDVDHISKRFNISRSQLYDIFKEIFGAPINDYLVNYRMTQAKNMLLNTELPVEIVSQNVGYSSLSSFSRSFKIKVGISPLRYRKKFTT
jgi:AraC-like DNA-binding protein